MQGEGERELSRRRMERRGGDLMGWEGFECDRRREDIGTRWREEGGGEARMGEGRPSTGGAP